MKNARAAQKSEMEIELKENIIPRQNKETIAFSLLPLNIISFNPPPFPNPRHKAIALYALHKHHHITTYILVQHNFRRFLQ